MEDLGRQVGHVAVEEDEEWLDDARVRGEAGREGAQDTVDGAHQQTAQGHHEEAHHRQHAVQHRHRADRRELFEQVVEDLEGDTHTHTS